MADQTPFDDIQLMLHVACDDLPGVSLLPWQEAEQYDKMWSLYNRTATYTYSMHWEEHNAYAEDKCL